MKARTFDRAASSRGILLLRLIATVALVTVAVGYSASAALAAPVAPVISGPTSLKFIHHPLGFSGAVTWSPVPTAVSYRVYDADTSTLLSTVTGTTHWVYGLQGTPYRRYVVAVDAVGDTSPPSNTLTIQTVAPAPPAAPSGFGILPSSVYDVQTSAAPSGMTVVSVPYDALEVTGDPAALRLFHYTGGSWVDITTSVDTVNKLVIGSTSSFSPFAVMQSNGTPVTSVPASSPWSLALLAMGGVAVLGCGLALGARRGSQAGA
jgi:hypothetical protein